LVESEKLTVQQLRTQLADERATNSHPAKGRKIQDLGQLVATGQRFGTLYIDPPWNYGNQTTRAATSNHYKSWTIAELAALPVGELAADQSHLHLWTTEGFLEEAIGLLRGWGFERKSGFVWVKPQLGIGNYWRCSHEFMLLGVRGGLTFEPSNIPSWLLHKRSRHSAKPEAVRLLVEKVSPGPRLELFSRRAVNGWTVWGDQISEDLFYREESDGELHHGSTV
jgi:N6-adenosine-specific RNA methylase IME4